MDIEQWPDVFRRSRWRTWAQVDDAGRCLDGLRISAKHFLQVWSTGNPSVGHIWTSHDQQAGTPSPYSWEGPQAWNAHTEHEE